MYMDDVIMASNDDVMPTTPGGPTRPEDNMQ